MTNRHSVQLQCCTQCGTLVPSSKGMVNRVRTIPTNGLRGVLNAVQTPTRSFSPPWIRFMRMRKGNYQVATALLVSFKLAGILRHTDLILDQTFSGALLSSVTCSGCGSTSTTTDPILDIQLDFPSNIAEGESLSLTSMLRRFCAEERVGGHGRGYECSSCGGTQGAVAMRKLSIKKLPPVLSFQLKVSVTSHHCVAVSVRLKVHSASHTMPLLPKSRLPSTFPRT